MNTSRTKFMPIPIWENAESRVATNVCRYLKTWEKEGGYRSRGLRVTKMKLLTSNAASRSRLILEQCIEYIYISNNIYWTIHRIFIEIEFSLVVVDLLLSHLRASRPWRRGRPIPLLSSHSAPTSFSFRTFTACYYGRVSNAYISCDKIRVFVLLWQSTCVGSVV